MGVDLVLEEYDVDWTNEHRKISKLISGKSF